jgi:hypothetical protein
MTIDYDKAKHINGVVKLFKLGIEFGYSRLFRSKWKLINNLSPTTRILNFLHLQKILYNTRLNKNSSIYYWYSQKAINMIH